MASIARSLIRSIFPFSLMLALLFLRFMPAAAAQEPRVQSAPSAASSSPADRQTIHALFISDIHFDPFHDPGKAKQLDAAPASEWGAILAAAPSLDQHQAFDSLQQRCHATGA